MLKQIPQVFVVTILPRTQYCDDQHAFQENGYGIHPTDKRQNVTHFYPLVQNL